MGIECSIVQENGSTDRVSSFCHSSCSREKSRVRPIRLLPSWPVALSVPRSVSVHVHAVRWDLLHLLHTRHELLLVRGVWPVSATEVQVHRPFRRRLRPRLILLLDWKRL